MLFVLSPDVVPSTRCEPRKVRYLSEHFPLTRKEWYTFVQVFCKQNLYNTPQADFAARSCIKPVYAGKGGARPEKALHGGLRRRQAAFARVRQPRAVIPGQRLPPAVIHSA